MEVQNSKKKSRKPKVKTPVAMPRGAKPATSSRKKGKGQEKSRRHRVSGLYCYPVMQSGKKHMKELVKDVSPNAEASYDIDPFADQSSAQGQIREDMSIFKICASGCATYTEYSSLTASNGIRVVWREPLTYLNAVGGPTKIDARGNFIDLDKVTVTFKSLIHGDVLVKGNMPKITFAAPTLIASRPNPFSFELKDGASRTVNFQIGNKVLKFKQLEMALPDPFAPTLKQLWMALFDVAVMMPNIDEYDGEPYDPAKEIISIEVKVHYITTFAPVLGEDDYDPDTTQIINTQTLALQEMGPIFNVFHIDPPVVTLENEKLPILSAKDNGGYVVMPSKGLFMQGPRYGDYSYAGAKSIFTTITKVFNVVQKIMGVVELVAGFLV